MVFECLLCCDISCFHVAPSMFSQFSQRSMFCLLHLLCKQILFSPQPSVLDFQFSFQCYIVSSGSTLELSLAYLYFYSFLFIYVNKQKKIFFCVCFECILHFISYEETCIIIFFKNNFLIIVRYVIHVNLFNSYLFWIFRIIASEIFVVQFKHKLRWNFDNFFRKQERNWDAFKLFNHNSYRSVCSGFTNKTLSFPKQD